ncbi:unnamed protein product [Cylicocyclus nassatus]|uniref:MAM domain-containing protein n=1 Tax=Cylicocyclus nassatus TaxID=53992 RepID=A0AA36DSP5_CYLNA|nr:unnamed protein product [Cylicocyclus nassatus]
MTYYTAVVVVKANCITNIHRSPVEASTASSLSKYFYIPDMFNHRLLLSLGIFFAFARQGESCQPPAPVYRQDSPSLRTADNSADPPPSPPVPSQISFSSEKTLNDDASSYSKYSLNNGVSQSDALIQRAPSAQHREYIPYPGYIAPPDYPTLQPQDNEAASVFSQTNDINKALAGSFTSDRERPCPTDLRSLTDFAACIQIASVPPDGNSTSCDFEDNTFCRFQPTSSLFQVGRLPFSSHYASVAEVSGRTVMFQPNGNFIYALLQHALADDEEISLSAHIPCQLGNGILKFNYWLIGDQTATIKVCTQDIRARSCTKSIIYTDTSAVAVEVVHPQATEFGIEIVASNLSLPTLFIIDNIDYNAEFCDSSAKLNKDYTHPTEEQVKAFFDDGDVTLVTDSRETQDANDETEQEAEPAVDEEKPKRAPVSYKNLSACQLLTCTFSTSMCHYKNYENTSMSLVDWKLGNKRVGNIHTGIKIDYDDDDADGGFLFVGTDSSALGLTTYILESPNFFLRREAQLSFDVYRRSKDITLQLCLDSPFYCPFSISPFDKRIQWKQGESFTIPKNTTKIYFKAIQWRKFKWLAIDNIRLTGC